jgi:CheY-like chemotaxis protein
VLAANPGVGKIKGRLPGVRGFRNNASELTQNTRGRILEVFKRIHNEMYPRAGMRLAITRRAEQEHGGGVRFKSDVGHGSTFSFFLPKTGNRIRKADAKEPRRSDSSPRRGNSGGQSVDFMEPQEVRSIVPRPIRAQKMSKDIKTILVVDDEPSVRASIRKILQKENYSVLEAADFAEAVTVQSQNTGEIDMLLVDIALPGKNGYELAKVLSAAEPRLKVLFVSGASGVQLCRFYNMLATDVRVLGKPFQPSVLLQRIKYIMRWESYAAY